jgi:hypothetical protein
MYSRKSNLRLTSPSEPDRSPHIAIGIGMSTAYKEKQRLAVPSFPRSKSKRLLLIPAFALAIYVLSFLFHPSPQSPIIPATPLRSRNYLATSVNQTLEDLPNPFPFCPLGGINDLITEKYGSTNLARTRLHSGSGTRVQRVIRRAMSGLPITISVLGGSSKPSPKLSAIQVLT